MSTWTPGPWKLLPNGNDMDIYADGYGVATVLAGDVLVDPSLAIDNDVSEAKSELAANARLIALAPEMAEALANCVRSISLALNEHSNRRPKGLTGQMPERWLELSKQLTVTRALLARLEGKA